MSAQRTQTLPEPMQKNFVFITAAFCTDISGNCFATNLWEKMIEYVADLASSKKRTLEPSAASVKKGSKRSFALTDHAAELEGKVDIEVCHAGVISLRKEP